MWTNENLQDLVEMLLSLKLKCGHFIIHQVQAENCIKWRCSSLCRFKRIFMFFFFFLKCCVSLFYHRFTPGQGLILYPQIGDKMDIVCPRADASSGGKEEFYRVFLVSRSQLESCTIDQTDTPLLNCDKPNRDVKFTFKFQEFSPNLWGLEFLKGKDYYITCECFFVSEAMAAKRVAHVLIKLSMMGKSSWFLQVEQPLNPG